MSHRPANLRLFASRVALLAAVGAAGAVGLALPPRVEAAGPTRARPSAAPPVGLPGPAPRGRPDGTDVAATNAACGACHAEIASEWSGSMHRQAWVDPVFQSAYDIEPLAFCRSCHAPEADAAKEPTAAAADVGVSCTTCHVQRAGDTSVVVGAHGTGPRSPHPVLADPRMATEAACGNCHQFDFPMVAGAPMQDTLREHEGSRFAGTACQGCHMPERRSASGARWKSHAFAVVSDPAMIRSAATATARRTGSKTLSIAIEPRGAGHAFPTGDMFRRLEVRAVAVEPVSGRVLARAEPVHLGRKFAGRPSDPHALSIDRVEIEDSRLPSPGQGGKTVTLRFPTSARDAEIRWEVAYQRMGSAMAVSFGVDPARDEVIVVSGALPSPSNHVAAGAPHQEKNR